MAQLGLRCEFELPFAKIIILHDDIAEVIVNDGIEMDARMVEQYHDVLLLHLHSPFSLLINKINAYSYDFQAQIKLATLTEINAMGVVAYNRASELSAESLALYPQCQKWNLKIFSNRDDALAWLLLVQKSSAN